MICLIPNYAVTTLFSSSSSFSNISSSRLSSCLATIVAETIAPVIFVAVLPVSAKAEIGIVKTISSSGRPITVNTLAVVTVAVPGTPAVPNDTNNATTTNVM